MTVWGVVKAIVVGAALVGLIYGLIKLGDAFDEANAALERDEE